MNNQRLNVEHGLLYTVNCKSSVMLIMNALYIYYFTTSLFINIIIKNTQK